MGCSKSGLSEDVAPAAMPQTRLRIGDVNLLVDAVGELNLGSDLRKFKVASGPADVEVKLQWTDAINPSSCRQSFDSGAVWKLCREDDDFVFDFSSPTVGPHPYKQLRTSDFASARLTLNRAVLPKTYWPLEYPADELLITNYLARHGLGVEVHGCGLVDAATGGHLFLGHSGAGKSTTTRLWRARSPEILSDDRIILRLQNDELWMHGTPWHGEEAFASAAKAKLNRIFILQHGPTNRIAEMPPARAVGELFARCFPPFHNAHGLQNTVEFLERVIATVPCYEFQFVPDQSAVEMALNFHD